MTKEVLLYLGLTDGYAGSYTLSWPEIRNRLSYHRSVRLYIREQKPYVPDVAEAINKEVRIGVYMLKNVPDKPGFYGIYARFEGENNPEDWVMICGPWALGDGPLADQSSRGL